MTKCEIFCVSMRMLKHSNGPRKLVRKIGNLNKIILNNELINTSQKQTNLSDNNLLFFNKVRGKVTTIPLRRGSFFYV